MAEFDLPFPHREAAGGQQLAEKLFRVRVRGFVADGSYFVQTITLDSFG